MSSWSETGRTRPVRGAVVRGAVVRPFRPAPLTMEDLTPLRPSAPRSSNDVDSACDEAFRRGYEAGRAAAAEEAEVARGGLTAGLERALVALSQAGARIDAARAEAMAVAEEEIAAFAFEVDEAVLRSELALSDDPGREAVARALSLVPAEADVTVRLHPDDAATLDSLGGLGADDDGRRVTIVADPEVEPGGCIADTGACRIDAQLGAALERVRKVLLGPAGDE